MKSFYEVLEHYGNNGTYPYHMPGHKRRLKGFLPETLVKVDITEIEGFDNLQHARGILRELQKHIWNKRIMASGGRKYLWYFGCDKRLCA